MDALEAGLGAGATWADLNTTSPGTKRKLAAIAAAHGVPFADVAIMAPVPGRGLRVPMPATGNAAGTVATALNAFGAAVEVMDAARAAGCEDWLRQVVAAELTASALNSPDS